MRNVGIGKERTIVANCGDVAPAFGSRVDCDPFPNDAIVSYIESHWLTGVFQVLGFVAYRREGKHARAGSNSCHALHGNMA